jgi:adenosine deaminase
MMRRGCKVTLNTDDPVQCACTLDGEFSAAVKNGLITKEDIDKIQRNAVMAAAIMN